MRIGDEHLCSINSEKNWVKLYQISQNCFQLQVLSAATDNPFDFALSDFKQCKRDVTEISNTPTSLPQKLDSKLRQTSHFYKRLHDLLSQGTMKNDFVWFERIFLRQFFNKVRNYATISCRCLYYALKNNTNI